MRRKDSRSDVWSGGGIIRRARRGRRKGGGQTWKGLKDLNQQRKKKKEIPGGISFIIGGTVRQKNFGPPLKKERLWRTTGGNSSGGLLNKENSY